MKELILDTETTCLKLHPKDLNGNPFTDKNFLCYVGLLTHDGRYLDFPIEYGDEPYGDKLEAIQAEIESHDTLVGFNIKFDLHWLNRYGIRTNHKRIYDTQLAHFISTNQLDRFPSLQSVCDSYGLGGKLDIVRTEYWEKGIDTDEIPEDVLRPYLQQDVVSTKEVFLHQQQTLSSEKRRLVALQCWDLVTLMEIEKNGMLYDVETSREAGDKTQAELESIDEEVRSILNFPEFNLGSGDHISVVLYGGTVYTDYKEEYEFKYKDGRTAIKQRWAKKEHTFPRIVEPIKGSELKKEGFYATNESTLRSLRAKGNAKRIIQLLMKRAELEKLRGTYLHGIPLIAEQNGWKPNMIHGQLNQCAAVTGRLSSSKPNLQNFDKKLAYLFSSRYG